MVWLCHNSKVLRPFFKIPPKIVFTSTLFLSRRREIFILFPLNRLLKGKFLDISTYHQLYLLGRAHRRNLHTHTSTTETWTSTLVLSEFLSSCCAPTNVSPLSNPLSFVSLKREKQKCRLDLELLILWHLHILHQNACATKSQDMHMICRTGTFLTIKIYIFVWRTFIQNCFLFSHLLDFFH